MVFSLGSIKEVEEVPGETNLKLELIYNGRVGDAVKFIYRESKDSKESSLFKKSNMI